MPDLPRTPDGRYIVVEGRAGPRLWRASDPRLDKAVRSELVERLMQARRAVSRLRDDPDGLKPVRSEIDAVKRALGERGPVWWTDGAPDLNRTLVSNSPYADWWISLHVAEKNDGGAQP